MKLALILGFSLQSLFSSCVTPLKPEEVEQLSTCPNTSMEQIRKNLLLAGYRITSSTDEDLSTDFKQVEDWRGKSFRSIAVIKQGDQRFRFKVRIREERLKEIPTGESRVTFKSENAPAGVETVHKTTQTIVDRDEFDQGYYEGNREENAKIQREVCGS